MLSQIQNRSLKKAQRENVREVSIRNFSEIKTIGILSNPATNEAFEEIDSITKELHNLGKETSVLIYFDKQSENDIFTKNIEWGGLEKTNCNWYGKPKKDANTNRFVNKAFDVLVDLSYTPLYSLFYLFVQSKAKLKVMPTTLERNHFADFTLSTTNPHNKLEFIEEVIHYLEIINKDQK